MLLPGRIYRAVAANFKHFAIYEVLVTTVAAAPNLHPRAHLPQLRPLGHALESKFERAKRRMQQEEEFQGQELSEGSL